jgi:anti-sigma regulatory factor (Ser/Thr protein kinase)
MREALRLHLGTTRESIREARLALAEYCAAITDEERLTDIRTAASEACTHYVRESEAAHIPAPFYSVEANETEDGVTVVVSGYGAHVHGSPGNVAESIIRQAADRSSIIVRGGGRTSIEMHFDARSLE